MLYLDYQDIGNLMYLCCTHRLILNTIPGLLLPCPAMSIVTHHTMPRSLIVPRYTNRPEPESWILYPAAVKPTTLGSAHLGVSILSQPYDRRSAPSKRRYDLYLFLERSPTFTEYKHLALLLAFCSSSMRPSDARMWEERLVVMEAHDGKACSWSRIRLRIWILSYVLFERKCVSSHSS